MVGLFITLGQQFFLLSKTLTLVDGVVELRICVAHLTAINKQLKALHIIGLVGLTLCQRRNLHRMIHNKHRLNQVLLHIFFKEQVEDIALGMARLIVDALFICQLLCGFCIGDLIKVNTGILLYGFQHGHTLKGFAQIDHFLSIGNEGSAAHLLGHMAEHILCQVHHAMVVGIGLIQLHEGKFGVVTGVHSFVAEYPTDLIHPLQAADDQTL